MSHDIAADIKTLKALTFGHEEHRKVAEIVLRTLETLEELKRHVADLESRTNTLQVVGPARTPELRPNELAPGGVSIIPLTTAHSTEISAVTA